MGALLLTVLRLLIKSLVTLILLVFGLIAMVMREVRAKAGPTAQQGKDVLEKHAAKLDERLRAAQSEFERRSEQLRTAQAKREAESHVA